MKALLPISFLLFAILAFLPKSYSQADGMVSFHLQDDRIRQQIPLPGEERVVQLCSLKKGETYQVWATGSGDCRPNAGLMGSGQMAPNFTFVATESCAVLRFAKGGGDCDNGAVFYLSALCRSVQQNSPAAKSMTGLEVYEFVVLENLFPAGSNVQILSVTSVGGPLSTGTFFNGNSSILHDSGMLVTNGSIFNAPGPNNSESAGVSGVGGNSDPDLELIATGQIWDVSGFEFDFTVEVDTVRLHFVFASEEYCEYAPPFGGFNDVAGIFLSGPGIAGGFSNGGINLATLPGGNIPVVVSTVNAVSNTSFFVPNSPSCGSTFNMDDIQFDGFSLPITTATVNLIPGEIYHLRIVAADVGDGIYDSAIFLKQEGLPVPPVCNAPTNLHLVQAGHSFLDIAWTENDAPGNWYTVQWREMNAAVWNEELISFNPDNGCFCQPCPLAEPPLPELHLRGIKPCTNYEFRVKKICDPEHFQVSSAWSSIQVFSTLECNNSYFKPACYSVAKKPDLATISEFHLLTLHDTLGHCGGCNPCINHDEGYRYLSSEVVELQKGNSYPFSMLLATGTEFVSKGHVRIWIDFNHDLDFDDAGEMVFSTNGLVSLATLSGNLFIPASALDGTTRMRVSLNTDTAPTPCQIFNRGKVNDYRVNISPSVCAFNLALNGLHVPCADGSEGGGGVVATTGGQGQVSFSWSNGATGNIITNLTPGYYSVTATEAGGCAVSAGFTVLQPSPITVELLDVQHLTDCLGSFGRIDLQVWGGTPPFHYEWSNGVQWHNLFGIPAGIYSITVSDSAHCELTQTFEVGYEPPLPTLSFSTDASCGGGDGTFAQVNGSGGSGDFSYQWSNGDSAQIIFNLVSGTTYSVTATDNLLGCSATASLIPPLPLQVSSLYANAECGNPTGSISLTTTGGTMPYTFAWSNGLPASAEQFNLPPGAYSATVSDMNGCTATASGVVGMDGVMPVISGSTMGNNSCLAPIGAVSISVSPAGNYAYLWSNDATSEDLAGLPSGTYVVTVSEATGCTSTASFSVQDENTDAASLAANSTPASCNLPNGSAMVVPTGGTAPFSFTWSNGASSQEVQDLPPGSYSVTVTEANQCQSITSIDVENVGTTPILSGIAVANSNCQQANGALNLEATPATGNVYQWSNNATTEDLQNLEAGTYAVTVSNAGCTSTSSFEVADQTNPPSVAGNTSPAVCGFANGSASVVVTDGVAPFLVEWLNAGGSLAGSGEDLTGALPGNYVAQVTVSNGCSASVAIEIPNEEIVINLNETVTPVTSCAIANGSIELSPEPQMAYQFTWTNGANSTSLTDLPPGNYSVLVSVGTCSATGNFEVTLDAAPPDILSYAETPATCGLSNGSIILTVGGGASPYNFSWSNGTSESSLQLVPGGIYTVTVTGSNECTTVGDFSLNNIGTGFSATTSATAALCVDWNGAAEASVTGGIPPFAFAWNTGDTTQILSNVPAGTYEVTVSDSEGCTAVAAATVTSPPPIELAFEVVTPISCFGESDGCVEVTATGGTPPATFPWGSGGTLCNQIAGPFPVLATDANGCEAYSLFFIDQPAPIVADFVVADASCNGEPTGLIDLMPSGGMPPYGFVWSNGAIVVSFEEDISNLPAGEYSLQITDGQGCTFEETVSIDSAASFEIDLETSSGCSPPLDGSACVIPDGGQPPFVFQWSMGSTSQCVAPLPAGSHSVTVTDFTGCSQTTVFDLPAPVPVLAEFEILPEGDSAVVTVTSGTPPFSIAWSRGDTTWAIGGLMADDYSFIVTDAAGCSVSYDFTISAAGEKSVWTHFEISPNPVAGVLTVSLAAEAPAVANLSLMDVRGKVLLTQPVFLTASLQQVKLDVSALAAGIYFVQVVTEDGTVAKKVVKR